MSLFSQQQQERVFQYRRSRRPDSLSESQARPQEEDLIGYGRVIEPNSDLFPQVAAPPSRPQFGFAPGFPQQAGSQQQQGGSNRNQPTPQSGINRTPPAGSHPSGDGGGAAIPSDLTVYILDLERQNQELRSHITFLREALNHETQMSGVPAASAVLAAGGGGGDRLRTLQSEDEKRAFLAEILSQIEVVIQAHKNKTASEIQKYKLDAENAQLALKNLRSSIQQEGLDLTLAPAMISMQRRTNRALNPEPATGVALNLPPDARALLEGVANDVLERLMGVSSSDDVAVVVRAAVTTSFETIVGFFTDQLIDATKSSEALVEAVKAELAAAKDDFKTQLSLSENQRVQLVQQGELEIQALRDELRAFHTASASDDVQASVHERALAEYTEMLVESRQETNKLRQDLEAEKNHCAQVCLKLKSALQRRNAEFEKAVVTRAEEVVAARDKRISELESTLKRFNSDAVRAVRHAAVQVGDSSILLPTEDNFVPNVLSSVKKGIKGNATNNELFEKEVWRKTQELLSKYGGR